MQLTLVRHTKLNIRPGVCYGQSDVPLADTFNIEAEAVKSKLSKLKHQYIFSSPLSRCRKLAEYCGQTPVIDDHRLMELHFGDWEMLPWENIRGNYAERWMEEYQTLPCPNGESLIDLINRIQLFIIDLKQSNLTDVLIYTHGGPIRVFLYLLNRIKEEELFATKIDYGDVIRVKG